MQDHRLATGEQDARASPAAGDVRKELEQILSCEELQISDRRASFLRYVVEESLAGRAHKLKGFTVAVDVYGRDATFDPKTDPVVRLEARRLRRDLDTYYAGVGKHDPVRISIPKGGYAPRFEWSEMNTIVLSDHGSLDPRSNSGTHKSSYPASILSAGSGLLRTKNSKTIVWITAVALAVAIGWFILGNRPSPGLIANRGEPKVLVLPFEVRTITEYSQFLAAGLSQELIRSLMMFPGLRLYTQAQDMAAPDSPDDISPTYIISGSLYDSGEHIEVSAQLKLAISGEVIWMASYEQPLDPKGLIKMQHDLASAIVTEIGQPYGAISSDLNVRMDIPEVSNIQSYICVLRAYDYRRTFSRKEFDPVFSCLNEAVRRDPGYSDAWAMLGWLHLDAGRFEFYGLDNLKAQYQKAFDAASRAVALEPDNTLALKSLSSIQYYQGDYKDSEALIRKAVALNPNDPDTLAQLGWRLAARGNFDDGIPILEKAIERSVKPPGWYYNLIGIHYYMMGDYDSMLVTARKSASPDSGVSQALLAIASAANLKREETRVALDRMMRSGPIASDPAAYFRRQGATDEIVGALVSGLDHARAFAGSD